MLIYWVYLSGPRSVFFYVQRQQFNTTHARMHPWAWKGRIYGTHITYTMTPYRQKLFKGFFKDALPKVKTWAGVNWPLALLPLSVGGLIYYCETEYVRIQKSHWY